MHRYESPSPKTHENQLLQLRHERKMESQRLDSLKKELQAQLTTKAETEERRAA